MLTFCCDTLSMMVKSNRRTQPTESIPASSRRRRFREVSLRSLRHRRRRRRPARGPPPPPPPPPPPSRPAPRQTFRALFSGRDLIMLMQEFVARFSARNEKSFLFEILRRVGR